MEKSCKDPHQVSGKAGHPESGQTAGIRADGPPGRWKKKNIRNKKKQEAERRKEESDIKNIRQGRQQGRASGRASGQASG